MKARDDLKGCRERQMKIEVGLVAGLLMLIRACAADA
jgi:hypothetical protein